MHGVHLSYLFSIDLLIGYWCTWDFLTVGFFYPFSLLFIAAIHTVLYMYIYYFIVLQLLLVHYLHYSYLSSDPVAQ